MRIRVFLIIIGALIIALMLGMALIPPASLITSIIQWASGHGASAPFGCPMMEGYPCSYEQRAIAGLWVFVLMAIGVILVAIGFQTKKKTQ